MMKPSDSPSVRPRLCFLGPMVGRNRGYVVTQGERLSTHFEQAGYSVLAVSNSPNRYRRLLDMVVALLREHRRLDVVILHVYGGRSFVVEDIGGPGVPATVVANPHGIAVGPQVGVDTLRSLRAATR